MSDSLPLLVLAPPGRKLAWIERDGRAYIRGLRVPRFCVFFLAGYMMAKTSRFRR